MKKILIFTLILIFSTCALCGCSGNDGGGCQHVFSEKLTYSLQTVDGEEKIYTDQNCSECGKKVETVGIIVSSSNQMFSVMNKLNNGDVIYFKNSFVGFSSIDLNKVVEGVTLWFEEGLKLEQTIQLNAYGELKNIRIANADFYGYDIGITIYSDVDGLIIENCKFKDKANIEYVREEQAVNGHVVQTPTCVKNVVIENCNFTNVLNASYERNNTMAIKLANCQNLTVKNCIFDGVQYNALNVGGASFTGDLVIKNNQFKNVGSRVLNLHLASLSTCDISQNTFYSNEDYYDLQGKLGNYLGTEPTASGIVFGVNTWEKIPEPNEINFENFDQGNIVYDKTVQQLLLD